jgi:hypothetical protein
MSKTPLIVFAALFLCAPADAQVNLSFSGGSGAPFKLTLAQSMNYVINTNHGRGQIATFGVPVTEPGSVALVGIGGAAICFADWRRIRRGLALHGSWVL